MMSRGRVIAVVVLALVVGWFANDLLSPSQKRNRPLLNLIRNWWWVPLIIDEPKHDDSAHEVGPDGYPLVHHERSL